MPVIHGEPVIDKNCQMTASSPHRNCFEIRCVRSQKLLWRNAADSHATVQHQKQSFRQAAARLQFATAELRTEQPVDTTRDGLSPVTEIG